MNLAHVTMTEPPKRKVSVSTEGRVFVAQLTRDLAARERAGAHALSPGAKEWTAAFKSFAQSLVKIGGPVKAARAFRAAISRLATVQKQGSCFVNAFDSRSRSALFEVLTWEVDKHPLTDTGQDGIVVKSYVCMLQRNGKVAVGYGEKLAFLSWHALARLKERSREMDIFDANGVVAGCGLVGLLMRESIKHIGTEINYAIGDTVCAGVLRDGKDSDGLRQGFFDVLTVLPFEDVPHKHKQAAALAWAVHEYVQSADADPKSYGDKIDVLPFHQDDYVTRELKRRPSNENHS